MENSGDMSGVENRNSIVVIERSGGAKPSGGASQTERVSSTGAEAWLKKVEEAEKQGRTVTQPERPETIEAKRAFEQVRAKEIQAMQDEVVRKFAEARASTEQSASGQTAPTAPGVVDKLKDKIIDRAVSAGIGAVAAGAGALIEDMTDSHEERPVKMSPEVATTVRGMIGVDKMSVEEVLEDFRDMGYTEPELKVIRNIAERAAGKRSGDISQEPRQRPVEDEERKPAPIKPQESPAQPESEAAPDTESAEEWNRVRKGLTGMSDKVKKGASLSPSEEHQRQILQDKQAGIWSDFKGPDTQIQRHETWKDSVANEIDRAITRDTEIVEEKRNSLYPQMVVRDNPLAVVEGHLGRTVTTLLNYGEDGNPPPNKQEAIQMSWYEGVRRNVQAAALTAELAMYADLGISNKPEWKGRVEEIQKNLKELGIESDFLDFGEGVRDRTKSRLGHLAARYVDYLKTDGPRADELKIAIKEKEEKRLREEAERKAQQGPDQGDKGRNERELAGVKQMLLTALIEGGWQSTDAGGDRQTVRRWIAREGGHAETSLIKAQSALVDWVDKLGSGDKFGAKVETALLMKGVGSEEMEALENSEMLLKAKKNVLKETGFDLDSGVTAAEIRTAMKTLKYSDAELRERGMSDSDREAARGLLRRVLDKKKEFLKRKNPSDPSGEESVTFWGLKQNEYRMAVNKLFESTAHALGKTEVDDEARMVTMTAIRQIQHSGIWNMFHTSYAPHPFISSEMTHGFNPGDGYLNRADSNDKDFIAEKPGHFRLVTGNRDRFIRREEDLGVYDMSKAVEVPGYPGMTWNEMILPPENLISYALDTQVLSTSEALWDRWARLDPIKDRETDFFKMGPLFVPNNRRKVAARLSQMLDEPINVEKLVKPGVPILKEVGDRTVALMKDHGLLLGTTEDIRDAMSKLDNQEIVDDYARFALTRKLVFMVGRGELGKLDLAGRKFTTKWLATAMRGERIIPGTEDLHHKPEGFLSDEFWDYRFRTRAEGWGVTVSGEDTQSTGSVHVDLTNERMIDWLDDYAGLNFGSDLIGKIQEEITEWFEEDELAQVVAGLDAIGDSGPTVAAWENMTPRQAFARRRASSAVMGKKTISNATVGGLGRGRKNELRKYKTRPELAQATANMRYME